MNASQTANGIGLADPEVTPRAKRRSFSAEYKKKILEQADVALETGGIGDLLRREGLYSSTLANWRKERDAAIHGAFTRKRGPAANRNPLTAENEKLRRQDQRLQEDLRKAELIIDVQKKVAMLLGRPLPPVPDNGSF
jgi:transposase-like protein